MTQQYQDNLPLYQSFMTTPEWKNVEISEDLAEFLSSKQPLHHFVFLREAYDMNVIFHRTLHASLKHNSIQELAFPDSSHYNYFLMDWFVILMTNISMFASKLYCWIVQLMMFPYTIYAWYKPEVLKNDTQFQNYAAQYYVDFVKKLNLMPFYNIDYHDQLQNLMTNFQQTKDSHTWTDFWTYWYMRLEINSKMMLSRWMKSDHQEPDVTTTTVTFTGSGDFGDAFKTAKNSFLSQVETQTLQDNINILDEKNFKITTPRYMDFRMAIDCMARHGIHIEQLAGQERVQVKLEALGDLCDKVDKLQQICENTGSDTLPYNVGQTNRPTYKSAKFLYSYNNGLRTKTFFMIDMPTYELDHRLQAFEQEGFSVKFVHNF